MDKNAKIQREFFNELAPDWRKGYPVSEAVFNDLFSSFILSGATVLDVGCGTGVLSGYLAKRCRFVDAIDLSDKMIERAKKEVCYPNISFSVADFYTFSGTYDFIFVFDAYPHFADKEAFAKQASRLLQPGGTLVIAFDESREKIDAHHHGMADGLSVGLRSPREEAEVFLSDFSVVGSRDDDKYLLALRKRN